MSYTFLLEQEEVSSADSFSDIPRSVLSRLNLTADESFSNGNGTGCSPGSRSGTTSGHSTELRGEDLSMSCVEGSLAKTSVLPGPVGKVSRVPSPPFGLKCSGSFLKSSRSTYSQRTPPTSEPRDLDLSSKDLPTKGMMLRGVCYPLLTSVPTTSESGCGFSVENYLPIPTTMGNQLADSMMKHRGCRNLKDFLKRLPTPTAHNAKEGGYPAEGTRNTPTLGWEVGGKIPPILTEWMMGWPIGWTDLEPLEMGKFRLWQQQHLSS